MENHRIKKLPLILFPQSYVGVVIFHMYFFATSLRYVFRGFTDSNGKLTADPSIAALLGMLIDILSGIIPALLILWVVRTALVYSKLLKPRDNQKTQFLRFFGLLLTTIVLTSIIIPIYVSGGLPLKRSIRDSSLNNGASDRVENRPIVSIDNLRSEEKQEYRQILQLVLQNPEEPTRETHRRFWELSDKIGIADENTIEEMKDLMTGATNKYMRYFYEDALWALKNGRSFKSKQREDYEKVLISKELMTDFRMNQNEELIEKIALKKPIQTGGQEIVFTEEMILNILGGLNEASKRIDKLFTKKY